MHSPENSRKGMIQKFNPLYERLQLDFKNLYDAQMTAILPTFVPGSENSLKPAKPPLPICLFPLKMKLKNEEKIN